MKRVFAFSILALCLSACDKPVEKISHPAQAPLQCGKDTDCKGDRICENGQCTSPTTSTGLVTKPAPSASLAPAAPSVTYQSVLISGDQVGPFTTGADAINYQSRAGVMNILEQVLEEPEFSTYVTVEKAYAFGPDRYVLVISTGEGGRACPATTYAVSFSTATESVDGSVTVDGCSEAVDSLAQNNKLTIKKDGKATEIFNGIVR